MAVELIGLRFDPNAYASFTGFVLASGEAAIFSGVPGFELPYLFIVGDGESTVEELAAMRQYRPIYDYDDVDTDVPEAGVQVAIINAPDNTLYVTLITGDGTHTIAELISNFNSNISIIADTAAEAAAIEKIVGYVEVTENYEVVPGDRNLIITTSDAVTITIPEGLPIGTDLKISRTVASTNAVTVAKTGSDTIEGGSTFITHGVFESSTENSSEVIIKKVSDTVWRCATLPVVKADYSNQTVTSGSTALKYTTKVTDTHSAYDTGTGRYTFPISGTYLILAEARSSTTSYGRVGMYKGGSLHSIVGQTPNASGVSGKLIGKIKAAKGEYIDLRAIDYGLTANADDHFTIELIGF
jgi:hypothetical protein